MGFGVRICKESCWLALSPATPALSPAIFCCALPFRLAATTPGKTAYYATRGRPPLQSLLLTRNMSAPSQQLRPVPGTAAQPWIIYIHAAFPRSPKIAIFWCDFSTILCEFTRLTHILFGLILCKGKKIQRTFGSWEWRRRINGWLYRSVEPEWIILQVIWKCLIRKSSLLTADGLVWKVMNIIWIQCHADFLGAKPWKLFPWFITSDAFAELHSDSNCLFLNKRNATTELLLLDFVPLQSRDVCMSKSINIYYLRELRTQALYF